MPPVNALMNIKVSRYPNPKGIGWAGYIFPEDHSWIAFIDLTGKPYFFLHRHPVTGACLPDNPIEREAAIMEIDAERERGLHTGVSVTPEEAAQPGVVTPPGSAIPPLGVLPSGDGGPGKTSP